MNLFFNARPTVLPTFEPASNDARFALQPHSLRHRLTGRGSARAWAASILAVSLALFCLLLSSFASAESGAAMPPASGVAAVSGANSSEASNRGVVNINTADAAALAQNLRGVGQSRAQEIVRHREAFGPFASADELTEVKGIGQATLDQNRARITLE